ncbi:hypothetical protein JR904_21650 [Enterobacter roggenkampii]|uniref:hypothetical protein n=1 Tax=Enterobacter roggenkampii TaxID=1812935 RepID=UPI001A8EA1EC|nr:hypothetical protein [Enterobacter roggenkampii]MBN9706209.1 hypothetical protein [Enterobacter roggenkampii]
MGKMTFVVEFEDGKEPPVFADMSIRGGRLVAAGFHDYRDDLLTEHEVSAVIGTFRACGWITATTRRMHGLLLLITESHF